MKIIHKLKYLTISTISIFFLIIISLILRITNHRKKKVIFGTTPILNNKYWSSALNKIGIESETFMHTYYDNINKKDDYDKYFDDVIPNIFRKTNYNKVAHLFFVWLYIIKNAKVFVKPFNSIVYNTDFWRIEYFLFKINKIKIIILPYGSDSYMYSRIQDKSLQNALLVNYPIAAKNEKKLEEKIFWGSKNADFIMTGIMGCDGMPRWDIPIHQFVQINTKEWKSKNNYSMNNGINGIVKIIHTPNHRGFKGTEFLVSAINELKREGLQIELILLEKVQNSKVKEIIHEADILAEQFIFTGYALSGIEGMASGLPVLANLDNKKYTEIFRRYSFLNECPILSTTPETLKDNLKLLITNPELRKELGELSRKYVEKYHSYKMAQYLFTHIFKKIDGEDIDIMNLFHPLKSKYVQNNYIKTPLINNEYNKVKKA